MCCRRRSSIGNVATPLPQLLSNEASYLATRPAFAEPVAFVAVDHSGDGSPLRRIARINASGEKGELCPGGCTGRFEIHASVRAAKLQASELAGERGMTGPDGQVLAKDEHRKWVEDTTLEWKETEAPAYEVGKISLRGPVLPLEICDDPRIFIISSINTLPEHKGLGRISRAETVAAKASIDRRAGGSKGREESSGQDG